MNYSVLSVEKLYEGSPDAINVGGEQIDSLSWVGLLCQVDLFSNGAWVVHIPLRFSAHPKWFGTGYTVSSITNDGAGSGKARVVMSTGADADNFKPGQAIQLSGVADEEYVVSAAANPNVDLTTNVTTTTNTTIKKANDLKSEFEAAQAVGTDALVQALDTEVTKITTVHPDSADNQTNSDYQSLIQSSVVPSNSVNTSQVVDKAITSAKLADDLANSIGASFITTSLPNPLNMRIWDINPVHDHPDLEVTDVTFKWGWEKLSGQYYVADGADTIRITGVLAGRDPLSVSANDLVGLKLYSPSFLSTGKTYDIVSNLATDGSNNTVLTLDSSYQDESMTEEGYIVLDADGVEIKVTPYINSNNVDESADVYRLDSFYVTEPTFTVRLPLKAVSGTAYYEVAIRAWKGVNGKSSWAVMQADSYDPDHVSGGQGSVSYSSPFACQLPNLDEAAYPGSLTLVPTTSGFQIQVSGWKHPSDADQSAHRFEIIRTTLDDVDWNDYDNSIRLITSDRYIDVPTSLIKKWAVGVRPLQNGQVVGTAQEKSAVSGSMGVAPMDQALLNDLLVDLRTFSGSLSGTGPYTLTSIKIPSGDITNAVLQSVMSYLHLHECILKDSAGNEFIIDQDSIDIPVADVQVDLVNLAGNSFTPATGAFEINTTERGRRIALLGAVQIEYDSVKGYFRSEVIKGADVNDPAILRVCQNTSAGKSLADLFSVYQNDTPYELDTDFTIRNSSGALSLLFDAFDPAASSPNNTACLRGRFTLYMRPRIVKDEGKLVST